MEKFKKEMKQRLACVVLIAAILLTQTDVTNFSIFAKGSETAALAGFEDEDVRGESEPEIELEEPDWDDPFVEEYDISAVLAVTGEWDSYDWQVWAGPYAEYVIEDFDEDEDEAWVFGELLGLDELVSDGKLYLTKELLYTYAFRCVVEKDGEIFATAPFAENEDALTMPQYNVNLLTDFQTGSGIWKQSDYIAIAKPGDSGRCFDIYGIQNGSPYKTTFANFGYYIASKVDGKQVKWTGTQGTEISMGGSLKGKFACDIVYNGRYAKITYTVKNTGSTVQSFQVGSSADVMIDQNDKAPVVGTSMGLKMTDGKGKTFNLVVPDAATKWYGFYSQAYNNFFTDLSDKNTPYTGDSGMAWSWSGSVAPGGTWTRSALIGIGELPNPPAAPSSIAITVDGGRDFVIPGETVTVSGTATTGTTVHILAGGTEYEVVASSGKFSKQITIPADAKGSIDIICWAVSNEGGISETVTKPLSVVDKPQITLTDSTTTVTEGDSLDTAWYKKFIKTSSGTVSYSTISTATPGTYTVTYTAKVTGFTNATAKLTVTVLAHPIEIGTPTASRSGTTSKFSLSAKLSYPGADTITETGFVWGIMQNPTTSMNNGTAKTSSPVKTKNSSISLTTTDVVDGVTYYCRAYVIAGGVTYYSAQKNFGLNAKSYGTFTVSGSGNTFTIKRDGGSDGAQTVYYRTKNGSAVAGTHYSAAAGSVTFAQGMTEQTVTVTEQGANKVYNSKAATAYSNADREYFFEIYRVDGGGTLGATKEVKRTLTNGSSYTVPKTIFNDYQTKTVTKEVLRGDNDKDKLGWDKGGHGSAEIETITVTDYLSKRDYWVNLSNTSLAYQLTLDMKESEDGYQHFQIVPGSALDVGFGPNSGSWTGSASTALWRATTQHGGNSKNTSYATYAFPSGTCTLSSSKVKVEFLNTTANGGDHVIFPVGTTQISVGFSASGSLSDKYYTKNLAHKLKVNDTKEPQLIGVGTTESTSKYREGDTFYISLIFDEIVDANNSTLQNVSVSTSWGTATYAGGKNTNVLYFTGKVTSSASGALTLKKAGITGTTYIKDMCSASATATASPTSDMNAGGSVDNTTPTVTIGTISNSNGTLTATVSATNHNTLKYAWTQSSTIPATGWLDITSGSTATTRQTSGTWYLHALATNTVNGKTAYISKNVTISTSGTNAGSLPELTVSADNTNWAISRTITVTKSPSNATVKYKAPGSSSETTVSGTTVTVNANGVYTFTLTSGSETVVKQVTVSRIDTTKPTATITEPGSAYTSQSDDVTFTIAVSDAGGSGIKSVTGKWSGASTAAATLTNNGDGTYTAKTNQAANASGNWKLTVTVTDNAGNTSTSVSSQTYTVNKKVPTITVTRGTTNTNGSVNYTYTVTTNGQTIQSIQLPDGTITTAISDSFTLTAAGTYYVTVTDKAGHVVQSSAMTLSGSVDGEPPEIRLSPSTTDWVNATTGVTVTVSVYDNIAPTSATYSGGGKTNQTITLSTDTAAGVGVQAKKGTFKVTKNGTYTVTAKDAKGNTATETIEIGNIDSTAPTVTATVDNSNWNGTSHKVTITVNDNAADGKSSGVKSVKYALVNSDTVTTNSLTTLSGTTGGTVPVTTNGEKYLYCVVEDNAGNKSTCHSDVIRTDTTTPAITVTGGTTGASSLTLTASATFGTSGKRAFTVQKSGTSETTTLTDAAGTDYTVTSAGTYTFTATSVAGKTTTQNVNVYQITFNAGGGTSVASQIVANNGKAVKPADPTRTGYTFGGWYTTSGLTTAYNFNTSVTAGKTLYAKWTPNNYTVTYDYSENGGTSATTNKDTVAYGSAIALTPTATKSGWEFVGWNTDKDATTGLASLTMGAGNQTLYAIYKKTLTATFYSGSNSGTKTDSVTIYNKAVSGTVTAPALTPWSGYTPLGWNSSESAYTKEIAAETSIPISANTSYYGVYSREITLIYNVEGGTGVVPASQTDTRYANVHGGGISYVNPSFTLAAGSGLEKTGYTFAGWLKTPTAADVNESGANVTLTDDSTFYAKWTPKTYDVTLDTKGGTINAGGITGYTHATGAALPTDVTKNGYTFGGWYADEDCTGDKVTAISATETGKKAYYAKWTPVQYTISYNLDGGTVAESNPTGYTIESEDITLNNPTKTGFNFTGWSESGLAGGPYTTMTIAKGSTGNKVYTANWEAIKYTVTTDSEVSGGSLSVNPGSAAMGGVIVITVTPDAGKRLKPGTLVYMTDKEIEIETEGGSKANRYKIGLTNGNYQFTMPDANVTILGEFEVAASDGISTPEELVAALKKANGNEDCAKVENGVVVLQQDVTLSETLVIVGELTLDLNGHKIDTQNGIPTAFDVKETGKLTIKDGADPNGEGVTGNITVQPGGNLTITDVTVTGNVGDHGTVIVEKDGVVTGTVTADTGYIWGTVGDVTGIPKGVVPKVEEDGKYEVKGNPTVDGTLKVPGGVTVTIPTGSTLTVPEDSTVTIDDGGKLVVPEESTLDNEGTITGKGTLENDGTLINENSGKILGDIHIENNGTLINEEDGKIEGDIDIENKGTIDDKGSITGNVVCYHSNPATTAAVAAACTTSGNSAYYTCTSCGKYFSDSDCKYEIAEDSWILPALGHNFSGKWNQDEDGHWKVCSRCSVADAAVTHVYDSDFDTSCNICGSERTLTYNITYHDNGGSGSAGPATYNYGTGAELPTTDWTRAHYTFGGWYDNAGFSGDPVTTITAADHGDKDFYAKWDPKVYTIDYVLNGGTAEGNPVNYTIESETFELVNPEKTGYTFTGWSGTELTDGANTSVSIEKGSTGDRTYTAHFTVNSYNVTLHENGGTDGTSLTSYTYGVGAELPTDWGKTGYTFGGWYDNADFSGAPVTTISDEAVENKEYWAKWNLITYNITYKLNEGEADGNPSTYTVEDGFVLNEPKKEGYTFTGWSGTGLEGEANKSVSVAAGNTGNRNYTAHWTCAHNSTTYTAADPATCLKGGNEEYWTCNNEACGKVFSDAECTAVTSVAERQTLKLSHNYSYKVSGAVITEECVNGCGHSKTLTLQAEDAFYSGSPYSGASVAKDDGFVGTVGAIQYAGISPAGYHSATPPTDAGTYEASVTVGDVTAKISFAIQKTDIAPTLSMSLLAWTYGGISGSPSVEGNTGNGEVVYTYYTDPSCTELTTEENGGASVSGGKPVDAGTYYVKADIAATTNYNRATTAAVSFTIGRRSVTITGVSASDKEYDGTTEAPVAGTPVIVGLLESDAEKVFVSEGTAAFADKEVGTGKTVTFTDFELAGDKAGNYSLTAQPDSVTASISQAPVTIVWADETFIYNGTVQIPELESVTGIVGGDDCSVEVSGGQTNAGTYSATASLTGTESGNYILSGGESKEFTIGQKELTGEMIELNSSDHTYICTGYPITPVVTVSDGTALTAGDYTLGGETSGTAFGSYTLTVTGGKNYKGMVEVPWYIRDPNPPTGSITVSTSGWKSFLNAITFGLFFKERQTVTITGTDGTGESGVYELYYYLSETGFGAESDLAQVTDWTKLTVTGDTEKTGSFSIDPDKKLIIYAKITDESGNVTYINSDGIVLDATAPTVEGVTDGQSYCAAQTVTVSDDNFDQVTVNGNVVTLEEGQYTLVADGTEYTIVASDKAGNSTTVTVTLNNGHTPVTDAAQAPTCTETGLTEGSHCLVCGEILAAQGVVDALGHNADGTVAHTDATCTEAGVVGGTYCTRCDNGKKAAEAVIDALGHNADGTVAHKDATCTETGVVGGTYCTRCDNGKKAVEAVIDALGHNTDGTVAHKDATCTEDGVVGGTYCTRCDNGKKAAEEAIPALGHNTDGTVAHKDATCLTDGVVGGTYCIRCDNGKEAAEAVIDALGHNADGTVAHKDATCTETGVVGGTYCTRCDNGKEAAEAVIDALGHNADGTVAHTDATCTETGVVGGTYCTRCDNGKVAAETTIPALGHNTDGMVAHKDATCTETGVVGGTYCTRCDNGKVVAEATIPALGHNTDGMVAHKDATCTETGVVGGTYCTRCDNGKVVAETTIPALGHNTEGTVAHKDATCTETGVVGGTYCTRCDNGKVAAEATIPAPGHNTEGTVAHKDATCTETGVVGGTYCTRCDNGKKAAETAIPALGHDYSGTWGRDAAGHWKECSRCGTRGQIGSHSYDDERDATCNICGYTRTVDAPENNNPDDTNQPPVNDPGETGIPNEDDPSGQPEEGGNKNPSKPVEIDGETLVITGEKVTTGNVPEAESTETTLDVGKGKIVVTVVCEDKDYTAGVADTVAVANAVLKPEQLKPVSNGETVEIRVDIKDISGHVPVSEKDAVEECIEQQKEIPDLQLGMYMDISMYIKVGNGDWDTVTQTKEPIEVVIGIPKELQGENRNYYIVRSHEGEITLLYDTDNADDTITIKTGQFSTYAIAYTQMGDKVDNPIPTEVGKRCSLCHICPTFLGICCFVWLAVLVLTAMVILWMVRRKRRQENNKIR